MTFETLEYVDADGDPQEVAFQNLSAKGVLRASMTPRSHTWSDFQISLPQPPETPIVIPFKSRCIVRACRTSTTGADNSFSAGEIIFQGRCWQLPGSASSRRVNTEIIISDALRDLAHITFQILWNKWTGGTPTSPTYTTYYFADVCLFLPAPSTTYSPAAVNGQISTWQQIQELIHYATNYASGDDAVDLQLGGSGSLTAGVWSASTPEFTPSYTNSYPVHCMKCLNVLQLCLRPHPGVYLEIDYSTTPPTLHLRDRAHLTAKTLPYKSTDVDSIVHEATDIEPLFELVPDRIALFYKINGTYNGQPIVSFNNDIYPVGAPPSLLSEEFAIDITGAAQTETRISFNSTVFDPTDLDLWRTKCPGLQQIAEGGQIPNTGDAGALALLDSAAYNSGTHPKGIQVIDESGAAIDYSSGHFHYLTEDSVYTWFTKSDGTAAGAVFATVKAFFSYNKITAVGAGSVTDVMQEHEHHFRVLLTNIPSSLQILKQTVNAGESIPAGLAENIYTELSTLQWRLHHSILQVAADEDTVPTLIKPGKHKINLAGGSTDWETMNAVPENVTIEFMRTGDGRLYAHHSISCGPVNHLEPGYLVQLFNLFANRDLARIDASTRLTGATSGTQVDLSGSAARENSTAAPSVPIVTNHVYVVTGSIAGQVVNSAKGIADILAATTPTPKIDATEMKTMKPREIKVCDDDGNIYYIIVQATGGHTKP